jgi:putative DNA primase/helicase
MNYLMDVEGKSFSEMAKEIDDIIGNTHQKDERAQIPKPQKKTLSNLQNYQGTDTEIYLKTRGIINMPQMSISHSESEPYYDSEGKKAGTYPAMVAKITDSLSLEVLQIHMTYLKNGKKFDRKVKGIASATDFKTPCIRLFQAEKTLGIAEGIETALAAHDMYDVPTWATVNSGFMKKFRPPLGVTEMYIFADNDKTGTGHAAAFECARASLLAKNDVSKVTVIWPNELGDFNDMDDKEDICHWTFER